MAAFDPSVISDIGASSVPDVAGSQGKALTLADLYDQREIGKIKLNEAKQSQSDMTYARQILSGKDLTKLEDQNAAVAEITKRNPQLGMQLMKSFQDQQAGKNELTAQQLQLYTAKNDIIGGQLYQLKAKHDQLSQQGMNEKQIHDAMQNDVFAMLQQFQQATLPDGSPLLNDTDRQTIRQGLGNGYSVPWVDSMVQRSKQAKDALAQKLAEQKGALAERKENDAEERTKIMDKKADADIAAKRASLAASSEEKLDPDDAAFMAQQYLAGDKSVLQNLGRGKQGAGNIIMVRKAIRSLAQQQGKTGADVAAKLADFNATVAEFRKIGAIEGGVEFASAELNKFLPLAREASKNLPRGKFTPYTQLVQLGESKISDPALRDLYVKTQSVLNAYDVLAARGGTDAAKREHNRQLLSTADSDEVYNKALDAIQQELDAAAGAGSEARSAVSAQVSGGAPAVTAGGVGPPSPTAGPAAGAPARPPPPPPGFVVQ